MRQFVEKGSQLLGECLPIGRESDRGKRDLCEAGSELLAGRGVGIHGSRFGQREVAD